jgi:hypothetical protein
MISLFERFNSQNDLIGKSLKKQTRLENAESAIEITKKIVDHSISHSNFGILNQG